MTARELRDALQHLPEDVLDATVTLGMYDEYTCDVLVIVRDNWHPHLSLIDRWSVGHPEHQVMFQRDSSLQDDQLGRRSSP